MEANQLIQTVTGIFKGADERNWVKVREAMADAVVLDYSSLSGVPASTLPVARRTTFWDPKFGLLKETTPQN